MKRWFSVAFLLIVLVGLSLLASCSSDKTPTAAASTPSTPVTIIYLPMTATPTSLPTPPTHAFVLKWGLSGTGDGEFDKPGSVRVNSAGTTIYVQDTGNNRLELFNTSGSYLSQLALGGYDFNLNSDGSTIVAGSTTNIRYFDAAGNPITTVGNFGSGPGQVSNASGVFLDPFGNLYETDYGNQRVQLFGASGNFILQWGFHGTGVGQFDGPSQVAAGSSGNIYVTDYYNQRVEVFTPSGVYLFQFGVGGAPSGLAISPVNQHVFVPVSDQVNEYFPDGTFWDQFGSSGSGDGQFVSASGVAVDAAGNIYVSDYIADRMQKFAP